jgi:hypothetical protein
MSRGTWEYKVHVGWIVCEAPEEAEVVRRYGLWLSCDCPVSRRGYFHWVRSDGPAVGLWVIAYGPGPPGRASFLQDTGWRVLTGYGHALSPSLTLGDVLMATAVFDGSVPETETLWPAPVPGVELGVGVVAAPVLGASSVPETPRGRQALYRQTGAWVVRPCGPWLEVVRHQSPMGLLLWVMDTVQERAVPDDPAWRLQRHRLIAECHSDRIERVLRDMSPAARTRGPSDA